MRTNCRTLGQNVRTYARHRSLHRSFACSAFVSNRVSAACTSSLIAIALARGLFVLLNHRACGMPTAVLWWKASARNEPRLTVRYRSASLLPLKAMSQSLAQRSINRRRHSGTRPCSARTSQCLGMDLASLSNDSFHHHPRHRTRGSYHELTRCTRPGGLLGFSCCRPATPGYYPLGVSSSSHMPLPLNS